jgi:nicotinate-nucleotide adenylyltransferase
MIGVFGGTFDPVHFGHLRPALEVLERLSLDEVRFIPAHIPPHKGQPERSTSVRAEMVAMAIARQRGFVLDTCELERDKPSYTVDTLTLLRERYGTKQPLLLMVGTDAFADLPLWHRWEQLLELAHVVIMMRPGEHEETRRFPANYIASRVTSQVSDLRKHPAGSILRVPVSQLDISATMIREQLRQGRSVRYLVPEALVDYIHTHHLYS